MTDKAVITMTPAEWEKVLRGETDLDALLGPLKGNAVVWTYEPLSDEREHDYGVPSGGSEPRVVIYRGHEAVAIVPATVVADV